MGKYEFAEKALGARWRKAMQPVEPRSTRQGLCDILSLPTPPQVPEEEMNILNMLFCIMSHENRNWLSTSQVALPYDQLIGEVPLREASLKSRVGLPALQTGDAGSPPSITEQTQIRRRFLDLVSMCIPVEERRRYPHILTLVDSHVLNTSNPPSDESSGVDAAAWCITNYFSEAMRLERGPAGQTHRVTPGMPPDLVNSKYDATLAKMEALIGAHPWPHAIASTPPSRDSVFSQLLVNAALNRHCLETWAFEKRLFEVLPMQLRVFKEVSETAPHGLDEAVREVCVGGRIDYLALIETVLARTLAEKGKKLTAKVQARIDEQADAVIASAGGDHFDNEWTMNGFLAEHPHRAKALLWIMLTWCYEHGFEISNEDPRAHRPANTVISTRSELILVSQDMSTLRRMLMTPVFSHQWESPSPERLELHARQNSAIRTLVRRKLEMSLKGASLAQWEAAAFTMVPKYRYLELMKQAEVGTLMRDYANYQPSG